MIKNDKSTNCAQEKSNEFGNLLKKLVCWPYFPNELEVMPNNRWK